MAADDEYTTPPSSSEEEEESLSEASWSDVSGGEDDFLQDVEASDLEEGEESEPVKPRPKPPARVKPPASKSRLTTNGALGGANDIVGRRLKPPTVVQVSCKMLFDQIESGEIDLEAEYQRAVVWPEKNQSKLIDSILRNYYIPPVVFSKEERENDEVKICVDGKQRLTSIWKFMSGEIPYTQKKTGDKFYWSKPTPKSRVKILPDAWKAEFGRAQITTVSFTGLSSSEEREIFQRVQLGMALTTPEKWQALQGPWPDLLRELRLSYFNEERPDTNILSFIQWDSGRAKDFQDLVRMAFLVNAKIIMHDPAPPISTDKLEMALMDEDGPSKEFKDTMTIILVTILRLVRDPKYKQAFSGKVAPVELVMTAVLIGRCMGICKDAELADGIKEMRADVRRKTAKGYVMWKPEIVKKMLNFIEKWKSQLKRPQDRSGVSSRVSKAALSSANGLPKKRKIVEDSSDEEPLQGRNVRPKLALAEEPYRIAKKSSEASREPTRPLVSAYDARVTSSKIGDTNVSTPQRVELPPLVSRASLLSQKAPRSTPTPPMPPISTSMPALKKENKSPVTTKPPASVSTPHIAPIKGSPSPMDGFTLVEKIDLVSKEITALSELVAQNDRPDHAELVAKLQEKGTLKSQLLRDKFLNGAYRKGASSRPVSS